MTDRRKEAAAARFTQLCETYASNSLHVSDQDDVTLLSSVEEDARSHMSRLSRGANVANDACTRLGSGPIDSIMAMYGSKECVTQRFVTVKSELGDQRYTVTSVARIEDDDDGHKGIVATTQVGKIIKGLSSTGINRIGSQKASDEF